MIDSQDGAEGGPQAGGELCPSVGCDDRGNTEPLNPAGEEGRCAVGGGDATERNCLWPACGPVDDGEKIGETRGLRKWPYQIDMDVFETAVRDGDGGWGEMDVAGYFRLLAVDTLLCIPPDILADPGPAKLAGDQPDCCFHSWMSDPVEGGGGRLAERRRYQGPKNAGGDVAEYIHSCNCPGCDEK
jgi:hypothetical protein